MPQSVTMPRLGESVSEGTVTRWLKQEGERVEVDEPLLEVSTDKVDTEIPSPVAGVLASIRVREDETVEVGVELAVIDDGQGPSRGASARQEQPQPAAQERPQPPAQEQPQQQPVQAQAEAAPEPPPATPPPQPRAAAASGQVPPLEHPPGDGTLPDRRPRSSRPDGPLGSPLVRRLAAEHGVDLSVVEGTGLGGRIRKQDVLDAAQRRGAQQPSPAPSLADQAVKAVKAPADTAARGKTEPMGRLRTVIAERMVESLQVSAQLTTVVEVDVTRIARLREQAKVAFEQREGVKLSFLPFFAQAALEALKDHPVVNAGVDQDAGTITFHDGVHLGIAVDTDRGLLVPVVHNAGDLNLAGLARRIADVAERTRANRVTPDELGGGTFTVTNTGSRGALFDTPILNQPQVAILGTGAVVRRPVVIDDPELGEVVAVRSMAYLALTYDHRVVDGADAARFLTAVKQRLEEGAFAVELGS